MKKLLLRLAMKKAKKQLINAYSEAWYDTFAALSMKHFDDILPKMPDIGTSVFASSYKTLPAYIAWYKALADMGTQGGEINRIIWMISERTMQILPQPILKLVGKGYIKGFRTKAVEHIRRQNTTGVHPYDWLVDFRDIDENCFEIDIKRCPYVMMSKELGAEGLLPGVCRGDYLSAHLVGNGFERTKTLGDGDDCCNCRYYVKGDCDWSPEKGFENRK